MYIDQVEKLAYYMYLDDINNIKAQDTFYSIANTVSRPYYKKMANDIVSVYHNSSDKIYAVASKICGENKNNITNYFAIAYKLVAFLNKLNKKYSAAIVYVDTSGSIDIEDIDTIISGIRKKYQYVDMYMFDTELYGPYRNYDDFISNLIGRGGTDGLVVVKDIMHKLGNNDIEFIVVSDFYMIETKEFFDNNVKPILELYGNTLTTIDVKDKQGYLI